MTILNRLHQHLTAGLGSIAEVQGHTMFLDPRDHLRLAQAGVYEPFETAVLRDQVRVGDTVLDLGANIGYYTLILARSVGPSGKVFAYEPDSANFALLKKNVRTNGYRNVVTINKAVTSSTGRAHLYLSEDIGDHRIYDPGDTRRAVAIEAVALDDEFLGTTHTINVIKMDVQGAEWAVLQGMQRILRSMRHIKILTEFWPTGLSRFGVEPESYLDDLRASGFSVYHLDERAQLIKPIEVSGPIGNWMPDPLGYTNLLCLKGE